jgi:hypothetical protein
MGRVSHFILACARDGRRDEGRLADALRRCGRMLRPPGVTHRDTRLVAGPGLTLAVVDPGGGVTVHDASVCLGRILDAPGEWWRPGATAPDGVYALCRCSPDTVEIVTDIAGSRPVWYYQDGGLFLASSSQRALVALLGDFRLDREAVTWMVAARSLGPRASYDERLSRAPQDGTVRLHRASWSLETDSHWEHYRAATRSDDEHARLLNDAIVETCRYLAPDAERWPLLLSGGYDSRALLVGMLQAGALPRCLTWGFEAALADERSDASIARRVATAAHVEHEFFALDRQSEAAVAALEEFVIRSEGQVMDFTMYVDGFAVWRTLADRGCVGVIRGDNYPWAYLGEFRDIRAVRHHCGADFVEDYAPGHPIRRLGLAAQSWPAHLEQRRDEDLLRYRDRLQRTLYIPARVAPLNQIKSSFVEVVNPLKARRVATVVKSLPERLRLHPGALARVLELHGPPVPFADRPAATLPEILTRADVRAAMADGLSSGSARLLFDHAALDEIVQGLLQPAGSSGRSSVTRRLRAALPRKIKDVALPVIGNRLDTTELALRMFIAARAVRLFREDAERAAEQPGGRELHGERPRS